MRQYIFALFLAGACLLQARAEARSVYCEKASTVIERAICDNEEVVDLDIELAGDLERAIAQAPFLQDSLVSAQRHWLADRNSQCLHQTGTKAMGLPACLADAYRKRIAQLKAQTESEPGVALDSCRRVAEWYAPVADAHPGEPPLSVLAGLPHSRITLAAPVTSLSGPASELIDWAAQQNPPIRLDEPSATRLLPDGVEMAQAAINRLPGENFYSISTVSGTAHCFSSVYFYVDKGGVILMGAPPGFEEEGGAACMVSRAFGRIDDHPVFMEEAYDFTPNMASTLKISTWDKHHFSAPCSVSFHFAPKFSAQTLNSWQDSCRTDRCGALRDAAFALVASVQQDPEKTLVQAQRRLTPTQMLTFQEAAQRSSDCSMQDSAATVDPGNLLYESPLCIPYVDQGQVYLVRLGHFTIGWRYFADWSVRFQGLDQGEQAQNADFAVGMVKGKLEKTSVTLYGT